MATRHRMTPGDEDVRHGTVNGYSNLRCRCADCRRAWSARTRRMKAARVPPPPGDGRHGSPRTYTNRNCRCAPCTEAHRVENAVNKAKAAPHERQEA